MSVPNSDPQLRRAPVDLRDVGGGGAGRERVVLAGEDGAEAVVEDVLPRAQTGGVEADLPVPHFPARFDLVPPLAGCLGLRFVLVTLRGLFVDAFAARGEWIADHHL